MRYVFSHAIMSIFSKNHCYSSKVDNKICAHQLKPTYISQIFSNFCLHTFGYTFVTWSVLWSVLSLAKKTKKFSTSTHTNLQVCTFLNTALPFVVYNSDTCLYAYPLDLCCIIWSFAVWSVVLSSSYIKKGGNKVKYAMDPRIYF